MNNQRPARSSDKDKDSTEGSVRLVLTVEEVGKQLSLSRGSTYEAIRTGQIPSIRIGRRILIPRAALERLLDVPADSGNPTS